MSVAVNHLEGRERAEEASLDSAEGMSKGKLMGQINTRESRVSTEERKG